MRRSLALARCVVAVEPASLPSGFVMSSNEDVGVEDSAGVDAPEGLEADGDEGA